MASMGCGQRALAALGVMIALASLGEASEAAPGAGAVAPAESKALQSGDLQSYDERVVVVWAAAYMAVFVIGNFLHRKHIAAVPESVVAICVGALIGWICQAVESIHFTDSVRIEGTVSTVVLNFILLPIIIFESGWSLRRRHFFHQLGYILIFAVFGTLISTLVVGSLILSTSDIHGVAHARTAFAYAALISAVDPVATLSTYSHLNVEPLLSVLVFGESVINDAVAIALFKVLNDPSDPGDMFSDQHSVAHAVSKIAFGMTGLLLGSIALGLALGCFHILVLRFGRMSHSPAMEILYICTSSYFTYAFAEGVCGMSGIITVLLAGILMRCYATPHLTVEGRILCSFLLKQMASVADLAVFFFVGIAVTFVSSNGLIFGCLVMAFCLAGRAAAVVPLGLLTNAIKAVVGRDVPEEKKMRLTWRHLFMMFHAGLRGGIALMLTLELGPWVENIEAPDTRDVLRNATVVVICCFLLVFGGTTPMTLRCLGIQMGEEKASVATGQLTRLQKPSGCYWKCLQWLHTNVVNPALVGKPDVEVRMRDGVVTAVLAQAERLEGHASGRAGSVIRRHRTVSGSSAVTQRTHVEDMFGLFGTDDPAGLKEEEEEELDAALEEGAIAEPGAPAALAPSSAEDVMLGQAEFVTAIKLMRDDTIVQL